MGMESLSAISGMRSPDSRVVDAGEVNAVLGKGIEGVSCFHRSWFKRKGAALSREPVYPEGLPVDKLMPGRLCTAERCGRSVGVGQAR